MKGGKEKVMKNLTYDEAFRITYWSQKLMGGLTLIIYEKEGECVRHVKFLADSPELGKYLSRYPDEKISVAELNSAGAEWVDEEPYFMQGMEVPVEVAKKLERFCKQQGVTVEEYLRGLSCFLCNPAHNRIVIDYIERFSMPDNQHTDSNQDSKTNNPNASQAQKFG